MTQRKVTACVFQILLSNNLRGRITFGNGGLPLQTNYLGGNEGQPGGSPKPLKNKF